MANRSNPRKRKTPASSKLGSRKKKARTRSRKKKTSKKQKWLSFSSWPVRLFILSSFLFLAYVIYLDVTIRVQFEGKRWALPAKVYARPLELYPGKKIATAEFLHELKILGYRYAHQTKEAGTYAQSGEHVLINTRPFLFWDGEEVSRQIRLRIVNEHIERIDAIDTNQLLDIFRLEPAVIGRIYPAHNEDRELVKLNEVPTLLVKGLLALEDRSFFEHHGLNPKAIARAIIADIRAGKMVQGGSTLTQQLVKNFFLDNERTLVRKLNEALMSLLLEWHYDKDEILEAYINEIYLGQDKKRAIHGFGLASRFYYDKPLSRLNLSQIATLITLVRGPSYYDPWRNPKRLIKRRNLVLSIMAEQKIITHDTSKRVQRLALDVIPKPSGVSGAYPAFMELVRRQLRRDYRARDLSAEGLQIFTGFDPTIQKTVEQALTKRITQLDKKHNLSGNLQGAVVITESSNGEVLALAGDRAPRYAGFNRALDAHRPIGSLVKPAVYLTALESKQNQKYNLTSLLDDNALTIKSNADQLWSPRNYDGKSHGQTPLVTALMNSYNQATVRLGMELGFEPIVDTLKRMGVMSSIDPYPSMLLGAVNLSPYQVARMYQTLASGGFNTPLRAVREVLAVDGSPLRRFPLKIEQTIQPENLQLLNSALTLVTQKGTARYLANVLPETLQVAGKTGTTNDLRDSWFAGYSSSHLGVVWLGQDNNQSIGMSGSSGALRVWADIFRKLETYSLEPLELDSLTYHWIDSENGLITDEDCPGAIYIPFYKGTEPEQVSDCQ
ncbi:MAG: penicillin-binding protein 1B [Gammaproteobacteria bacterium]|nr:penicillin-binding protein 1B [Gammaproteobacteria bacterium]